MTVFLFSEQGTMPPQNYIRWFRELSAKDVPLVGGKTASLGELYSMSSLEGIRVPNGFGITAEAYRAALASAGAWDELRRLLKEVAKGRLKHLAKAAASAREIVYRATDTAELREQVNTAYAALEREYGKNTRVAVRSS